MAKTFNWISTLIALKKKIHLLLILQHDKIPRKLYLPELCTSYLYVFVTDLGRSLGQHWHADVGLRSAADLRPM